MSALQIILFGDKVEGLFDVNSLMLLCPVRRLGSTDIRHIKKVAEYIWVFFTGWSTLYFLIAIRDILV